MESLSQGHPAQGASRDDGRVGVDLVVAEQGEAVVDLGQQPDITRRSISEKLGPSRFGSTLRNIVWPTWRADRPERQVTDG